MRSTLPAAALAVVAVLAVYAKRHWVPVLVGRPAPAFHLASLDGLPVSLDRYKGKLVLVNFWATTCPDCRKELPALDAAYRRHRAEGFEVLAPSMDGREAAAPFIAAHPASFTIAIADAKTAAAYGVHAVPSSLLIGPDGKVLKRYFGAIEPAELEKDIAGRLPGPSSRGRVSAR